MPNLNNKIKYIKKRLIIGSFICVFFLSLNGIAAASTLPMNQDMQGSVEKIRDYLQTLRRQAKFNLPNVPGASQIQSQFEKQIGVLDDGLARIGQRFGDVSQIVNLTNGLNQGNVATQIPQIKDLISKVQSFQNITSAGDIKSTFNQLSGIVPGFDNISGQVQPILDKINQFSGQDISSLFSSVGGLNTSLDGVQQAFSALQNPTQIWNGVNQGFTSNVTQLNQNFQNSLASAQSVNTTVANAATNAVNTANSTVTPDDIAETQNDLSASNQTEGGGNSVCQGDSAKSSGGGQGGDGVPVIEQPGPLLDLTKELVDTTLSIKAISQKTCEYTKGILQIQTEWWKKVKDDDPKAAQKAKDAVKKEADKNKKFLSDGRTASSDINNDTEKSLYPTLSAYINEEEKAARNDFLKQLSDSEVPDQIKSKLIEVFEAQVDTENEGSTYKAKTKPTEGFDAESFISNPPVENSSEFWKQFVTLAQPNNNLNGQYILNLQEKQRFENEYANRADKTWSTYQILPDYEECVKKVEYNGVTTCAEWKIGTPAKLVADNASMLKNSGVQMTIATDQAGEEDGENSVDGITEEISGETANESGGGSVGDPSSPYGNGDFSSLTDIFSAIPELLSLFGGGSGGSVTAPPPAPVVDIPDPVITMTKGDTVETGKGFKKTTFSWSASNAVSCVVDNNWITYGNGAEATIVPEIKYKTTASESDELNAYSGTFEVYHPLIFSYEAYTAGSITTPHTTVNRLNISGNLLTQTLMYTPVVYGLTINDQIILRLNNQSVSISAASPDFEGDVLTRDEINHKLIDAINYITTSEPSSPKGIEFSKYETSIDTSVLLLKRKTPDITRNYTYKMSCFNEDGEVTSSSLRVDF